MTSIQAKNQKVPFGPSGGENFSFNFIPVGQTVTIPINQIMLTYPSIEVDGTLILIGDMFIPGDDNIDNFSYDRVAPGKTVTIPIDQQMIVYRSIEVDGTLNTIGSLVLIF